MDPAHRGFFASLSHTVRSQMAEPFQRDKSVISRGCDRAVRELRLAERWFSEHPVWRDASAAGALPLEPAAWVVITVSRTQRREGGVLLRGGAALADFTWDTHPRSAGPRTS